MDDGGQTLARVTTRTEIPSGAKSAPFNLSKVSPKITLERIRFPIQVGLSQKGEIVSEDPKEGSSGCDTFNPAPTTSSHWFWIKFIQFAPDCHVQNVRICRWQSDALILQATKSIPQGDELLLWFGEDVLVNDLGIPPYLNPQNIRGGKNYTCHKCGKEFEAPNPLKVHLALACGTLPVSVLWSRMGTVRKVVPPTLNLRIIQPPTPAHLVPPLPFGNSALRTPPFIIQSQSIETGTQPSPNPCLIQRPVPTQLFHPQNGSRMVRSSTAGGSSIGFSPLALPQTPKSLTEQQAHLETIMSNMGRGKNGQHVCIYCGKLYSRKYGLKIHIRTHTGFKPLQCKICQRPFGDPSNLNKHVRLHSDGNTPYSCDICGKILVRKRDLDRHIRSRHTTLPLPTQQSAIDCSIRHENSPTISPLSSTISPTVPISANNLTLAFGFKDTK